MVLKSPRKLESDLAQERTARNVDRQDQKKMQY